MIFFGWNTATRSFHSVVFSASTFTLSVRSAKNFNAAEPVGVNRGRPGRPIVTS